MARCMNCGRPEEEHCPGFEAKTAPAGCVCDEESWGDDVTPICSRYETMGDHEDGYCKHCEHDQACHKESA